MHRRLPGARLGRPGPEHRRAGRQLQPDRAALLPVADRRDRVARRRARHGLRGRARRRAQDARRAVVPPRHRYRAPVPCRRPGADGGSGLADHAAHVAGRAPLPGAAAGCAEPLARDGRIAAVVDRAHARGRTAADDRRVAPVLRARHRPARGGCGTRCSACKLRRRAGHRHRGPGRDGPRLADGAGRAQGPRTGSEGAPR